MGNCAKCGKELSWVICNTAVGYWNNQLRKGYLDLPKGLMGNTKHRMELPEFKGKKLCIDCATDIYFGQQFRDALKQGKRQVVIQDLVQSADGVGKHIELLSNVAEKYGYLFKQQTHTLTENYGFGASAISITMVFEKIITTINETNFINCSYCKSRYDANQYFKCPNCGGTIHENPKQENKNEPKPSWYQEALEQHTYLNEE